ncbi:DUF952 domain-containing protein [Paracoccus wurundjeri]|uniref:DUF952 domain-containing protein n=1 Tax=Paracoccus onubensis TaxID=1675788 RepID=UPI00351D988F
MSPGISVPAARQPMAVFAPGKLPAIPCDTLLTTGRYRTQNGVMLIYKILREAEWAELSTRGIFSGAPVDIKDGFVHFSTAAQLPGTLAKHFINETGLTLVACDSTAMATDLKWEPSRGGDLFPHLYRSLGSSDILWTRPIEAGPDGHETGPLE